jgi:hypothetical protein
MNNFAPISNRISSCIPGQVFVAGSVKITESRLFWIVVNWSKEVFRIKLQFSFIKLALK